MSQSFLPRGTGGGTGPGTRWQQGLQVAIARLPDINPPVAAARSGCSYESGFFTVRLLGRTFRMAFPSGEVTEAEGETPASPWLRLILLHYLLTADGTAVADSWITYRLLPGAFLFDARFQDMGIRPLVQAFGTDIEGFQRAGEGLGGLPMSRTGDAGFRFMVLPNIPMGVVLYLGDEEMPASAAVLFDASASHYLPTEDLSILGGYLSREMVARRGG